MNLMHCICITKGLLILKKREREKKKINFNSTFRKDLYKFNEMPYYKQGIMFTM